MWPLASAACSSLATVFAGAMLVRHRVRSAEPWKAALALLGLVCILAPVSAWAAALIWRQNYTVRLLGDVAEQAAALGVLKLWLQARGIPKRVSRLLPGVWFGLLGGLVVAHAGPEALRTTGALTVFCWSVVCFTLAMTKAAPGPLRHSASFWMLIAFILRFPAQVTTANWRHLLVDQHHTHLLWLYIVVSVLPGILSAYYLYRTAKAPND